MDGFGRTFWEGFGNAFLTVFACFPLGGEPLLFEGGPLLFGGGPLLFAGGPLLFGGGPLLFGGGPLLFAGGPLLFGGEASCSRPVFDGLGIVFF